MIISIDSFLLTNNLAVALVDPKVALLAFLAAVVNLLALGAHLKLHFFLSLPAIPAFQDSRVLLALPTV